MQELRSTEILDKEIQSDARRKAEKILKKADLDAQEILNSISSSIEKAKSEKSDFYSKKIQAFEKDQNASVPLEKERFKVSFIQDSISENINAYLKSLSEEKRIEIVLNHLDSKLDKKVNAFVYGFDFEAAKKMLSKKIGSNLLKCEKTEFRKIAVEDDCNLENPQGIILETEDRQFRCRLTLSEIIGQILDKNRAELSESLFGGQL